MTTVKPTIVCVHGAWHRCLAFAPVTNILESSGYNVVFVDLPSVGSSEPLDSFQPDVDAVASAISTTVDSGADVLLFMHSYGGLVGTSASKGLTKADRRKAGKMGGISHLFYMCAYVLPEGASLLDPSQYKKSPHYHVSDDKKIITPLKPAETFYNDVDQPTQEKLISELQTHQFQTFFSKNTYAAYRDVPSTYLYCERDNALPIHAQKAMVEGSKVPHQWRTESLDASHSPFISMPEKVADAVRRAAGETV